MGHVVNENPIRANYTGQPIFDANSRTADRWFNPVAFCDTGRIHVRQCGPQHRLRSRQTDSGSRPAKGFSMTETVKLQIRGEAFNALNHTNLGTPNRFVNTPQFGTITEAATTGREIQLEFGSRSNGELNGGTQSRVQLRQLWSPFTFATKFFGRKMDPKINRTRDWVKLTGRD
jgi:hypothetical protein